MASISVERTTWFRLITCVAAGLGVGAVVTAMSGGIFGFVAGWMVLSTVFTTWTWLLIGPMDGATTRSHAIREDPDHVVSRVILLVASMASLIGVGVLLFAGSASASSLPWEALVAVTSVVASWFLVHTLFTLHYARMYHQSTHPVPIDFGDEKNPDYRDFAYLAFTLGMTYQVSDTTLGSAEIRRTALGHAMLSYLLGAVVIACTINLVVQLASSSG